MAGGIIARAIIEGDDTWRRFVPFELVWSGGVIGRAAAQVHYWWYRFNERSKAQAGAPARGRIPAQRGEQPIGARQWTFRRTGQHVRP